MTRKLRNKYILILATILLLALFLSSCVTQKKAETITEEVPVVEEIVVEEESPKLPTVKAVEATEEMWAQIIAQIPPKETEETPSINTPIVIEEEPIEETPEVVQEENEGVEEVTPDVVEEPEKVEEEVEEVVEEPAPTFTIFEDEKPQVELLGEDTGVVIKDDNSEPKAIESSQNPDKILQGSESDLNSTMPSWLYSEKERENSSTFTPIINIYETKEEEPEDDGIKPGDILEYGNEYKSNREDSVSIRKMQKQDLYNAALKFFAVNYPYVCMVFVVIIAVFLVKNLIKHINVQKKNDVDAENGVEFNRKGNDANDYVFNPMARAINDVDTTPSNNEEEKQTTTPQEQKNELKEEVKGEVNDEREPEPNSFVYVEKVSQEALPEATVFRVSKEDAVETEELIKEDDGNEQYYIEEDEDIVLAENEYEKEEVAFFQAQQVLEEQFGLAI